MLVVGTSPDAGDSAVTGTTDPVLLRSADVIVLPGSRSTMADLDWLRRNGLADQVLTPAGRGRTVVDICGGYQMPARGITDEVESGAGTVAGQGLLPTNLVFETEKHLALDDGSWHGHPVRGYEIHHGVGLVDAGSEPFLDGCRAGSVWGTTWHGTFDNDGFRRALLSGAAEAAGVDFDPVPPAWHLGSTARRESMSDRPADMTGDYLDTETLLELVR